MVRNNSIRLSENKSDTVLNAFKTLEKVSLTNRRSEKIQILSSNKTPILSLILDAALNFHRNFFIKKFIIQPTITNNSSFDDFINLLNKLETRTVTGNDAIIAVEKFLSTCDEFHATWYARIIRKDLRAGFDVKTAIQAGFNIKQFEVMLAKDGKKAKNLDKIISNGVLVSPKLDGYRCIAICQHGNVRLYSRNGTEYTNFPQVVNALSKLSQNKEFIFDGEIMSNDFNAMQRSAFASVRGTTVGDVVYHVFFAIPYEEWESDKFITPINQLITLRNTILNNYDGNVIAPVFYSKSSSKNEILALEAQYIEKGYEGAMIIGNIPYYRGRKSNKLLKFKTMLSQDCKVIDTYEGRGKYVGMLGGLIVQQENGVTCEVGSGFSDVDRQEIWMNRSSVLNRHIEVKYQDLTPDGVMRFPIFMRWRDNGPNTGKK